MSQANLATIQRLYEVWNREGGMPSGLPMFASDCEFVNPETAIEPGTHQGSSGSTTSPQPVAPPGCDAARGAAMGGLPRADLLQTLVNEGVPQVRCFLCPPRGPAVACLLLLLAI
jgi:hypothetical protein